ncbi:MAG TPA: hypothetical protein VMU64_03990 [Acidimicrobiales bacterium]|nr:hypothetical protein [Acidimicrobiales bacterium]
MFSPAAFAKKLPPNPVTCGFSATVVISPALSVKGVARPKGSLGTTSVSATYSNCHTAKGPVAGFTQHIVIVSKAAKDKSWKTDGNSKKSFYLGLCSSFASTKTTKSLAKAVKNLPVAGGILKGSKATSGTVGADVGFLIYHGTVKGGAYPTAGHAATISAGLTNNANNTNLVSGCTSGPVNSIQIDSSVSTATL